MGVRFRFLLWLPFKGLFVLTVLGRIVLLFGFFGRWWAARHHASGRDARLALYPAMTERKHPATTSEAV